jgi:two-component system, response regulator YesN
MTGRGRIVARRYFFLMLGVTFLVLIPSILITYSSVERVLKRKLYEGSLNELERVSATVTMLHSSTIPATVQLFEQKDVQRLMYGDDNRGSALIRRIDLLHHARLSNPVVDSIVVYNYRTQTVYSSDSGPVPAAEYPDRNLLEIVHDIHRYGAYRYLPRKVNGVNLFTVVVGYIPTEGREMRGAVSINITERTLRELFTGGLGEGDSEIVVLDRDGVILSHSDPSMFGSPFQWEPFYRSIHRSDSRRGSIVEDFNGRESLVAFRVHPQMGWHFLQITPAESVLADVHRARNRTVMIVSAIGLMAVIVVHAASRMLVRPVQRISEHIEELYEHMPVHLPDDSAREERVGLDFVDRTLDLVGSRMDILENYYTRHHNIHRKEVLRGIMDGRLKESEIDWNGEGLEYLGPGTNRLVILVSGTVGSDRSGFLHTVEALESRLPRDCEVVPLPDEKTAMVLSVPVGTDPGQFAGSVASEVAIVVPDAVLGVSSTIHRLRLISRLYQEAVSALNQRFRGERRRIYHFEEVRFAPGAYNLPADQVERMLREIKAGHIQKGQQILLKVLLEVREYRYEDFTFLAQFLLYEADRHLLQAVTDTTDVSGNINELRASTEWLLDIDTLAERLGTIFEEYTDQLRSGRASRRGETARRILELIQTSYRDPNLSPKSIADTLSLSTNYIRRMFREEFGKSVADQITEYRINECKRQLILESCSVKELYGEVGFTSYNYFFELFKKTTGMTPIEYRRYQRDAAILSQPTLS